MGAAPMDRELQIKGVEASLALPTPSYPLEQLYWSKRLFCCNQIQESNVFLREQIWSLLRKRLSKFPLPLPLLGSVTWAVTIAASRCSPWQMGCGSNEGQANITPILPRASVLALSRKQSGERVRRRDVKPWPVWEPLPSLLPSQVGNPRTHGGAN